MEKYVKIIEFLNSSDSEIVIVGLQYLKEVNIEIPKKVFRKDENIKSICDVVIYHIIYDVDDIYWKILLDRIISKIITYSPASCACNFFEYKFKVFVTFNRNN